MSDITAYRGGVDPSNYWETLLVQDLHCCKKNSYHQKRVIWTTSEKPAFTDGKKDEYMLTNIPVWLNMADFDLDNLPISKLLIRVHDSDDHALINELADQFSK